MIKVVISQISYLATASSDGVINIYPITSNYASTVAPVTILTRLTTKIYSLAQLSDGILIYIN